MKTATMQRADMRAAGRVELVCRDIEKLVEDAIDEACNGREAVKHVLREFLQALVYDLERADESEAAAA